MLIIGIILILVGALVLYFLGPEPIVRFAGGCLIVIGLVLVVLALIDTADVSVDDHGQAGKSQVVLADAGDADVDDTEPERASRSSWGR